MQLQPERIGRESMTAKPVRVDIEFEFFDEVLRSAPLVVPGNQVGSP